MKVFQIIRHSITIFLCLSIILAAFICAISSYDSYAYISEEEYYSYTTYKTYNGDAYTGIQNAIVDVSYNVEKLGENTQQNFIKISDVLNSLDNNIFGLLMLISIITIITCIIIILSTIQKLIEVAKIIKKERKAKERQRMEEQLAFMNNINMPPYTN